MDTLTRRDKIFFALIPVFIVLVLGTVGTFAALDVRAKGGMSGAKGVVTGKELFPAHTERITYDVSQGRYLRRQGRRHRQGALPGTYGAHHLRCLPRART